MDAEDLRGFAVCALSRRRGKRGVDATKRSLNYRRRVEVTAEWTLRDAFFVAGYSARNSGTRRSPLRSYLTNCCFGCL